MAVKVLKLASCKQQQPSQIMELGTVDQDARQLVEPLQLNPSGFKFWLELLMLNPMVH